MISYEEALSVLMQTEKLSSVSIPANESCGYVAAENITSSVSVPPFANSAMDGFAVRCAELADATATNPVALKLAGSTSAGDTPSGGGDGAWEIMTGAPMPSGYDSVVKIEDTIAKDDTVIFSQPTPVKKNIRDAGEDFVAGDAIIQAGQTISPIHVMALATVGQKDIETAKKPRITVLTTGKEIIDDADAKLTSGQIYNSNSPYLLSALEEIGVSAKYGGVIHDDPKIFESKVAQLLDANDIIISTGAVSMGKHDFIPDSLRKLGAEILFHKVAIRPGKPILYARFNNGTHYFGLPGNPVSAAVGLRFFVIPLLRHLQGQAQEMPLVTRLLMPHPKKQGLRFFYKAHTAVTIGGKLQVDILKGQQSFKIHPLLTANCWASLSEAQDGTEIGEPIEIYPLLPDKWSLSNIV